MELRPSKPSKERILLLGTYNSGKTTAWCKWAQWCRNAESPSKFYVIDTDHAVDRMADGWDDFYDNVVCDVPYSWDEYHSIINQYREAATANDVLVVDMIDKPWPEVQAAYTEKAFGKDIEDYFIAFKRSGQEGNPLAGEYGTNWQIINRMYQSWIVKVLSWPGHVIACTPADSFATDGKMAEKDPNILKTFGKYKVKPKGQKDLGHQFHTILLMGEVGDGWVMTTIKDRQRERMVNKDVGDWAMSYLVQVGGWKLS